MAFKFVGQRLRHRETNINFAFGAYLTGVKIVKNLKKRIETGSVLQGTDESKNFY
jgi:hypothetical protein